MFSRSGIAAASAVLLVLVMSSGEALECSKTTNNDGPQKNKECVFPFYFKKISHKECTNLSDPDGKFWCSTKVDSNGKHVGGSDEWGYCDCEATAATATTTTITTTTERTTTTFRTTTTVETAATDERNQLTGKPTENGQYFTEAKNLSCGVRLATGFIRGGEDTKRGDYPFIAVLGYDRPTGRVYGCGGSLINRRYVLTAAHCHSRIQPIVEVVLGEHNFEQDPDCSSCVKAQRFSITPEDIIVHEKFSLSDVASNGDDIALIRLPRLAITVDEDSEQPVLPVCLPLSDSIKVPTEELVVTGWGRRNNDPSDRGSLSTTGAYSNILQQLILPEVPIEKCKEIAAFEDLDVQKQICAGGEAGKDSCKGDSGGPLIARSSKDTSMYLIGIVSFGTRQCGAGIPGVYTNVKYYMDWIRSHLRP